MQIPIMRCPICNCEIEHTTLQESESKNILEIAKAATNSFSTDNRTVVVKAFEMIRQCSCGTAIAVVVTGVSSVKNKEDAHE